MRKKRWSDLTTTQKSAVVFVGTIQLALLAAALIDLRNRPADQINGSKRLWSALVFVNIVGPIAYFLFGRKRPQRQQAAA